jgi:hypothetical protein
MPISIGFHRNRDYGTVGCTIGLAPHVYVGAYGEDKADALHQAAGYAAGLKSLIDENPELRALMATNPYGIAALAVIENASDILKAGGSYRDIHKQLGPTAAGVMRSIFGR